MARFLSRTVVLLGLIAIVLQTSYIGTSQARPALQDDQQGDEGAEEEVLGGEELEARIDELLDPYFLEALTDDELAELARKVKELQAARANKTAQPPIRDDINLGPGSGPLTDELIKEARVALKNSKELRDEMGVSLAQVDKLSDQVLRDFFAQEAEPPTTAIDFPRLKARISVYKTLHKVKTDHQLVEVHDAPFFGRLMVIDGDLTLCAADHHHYHETLTHVGVVHSPDAKRALILGGGDGGALQQVLQYPGIKDITVVEIDSGVTDASKEFFPNISRAFYSPRVTVVNEPAEKFVEAACERSGDGGDYDLVILDVGESTLAAPVFEKDVIRSIHKCVLKRGGILTGNIGTGWGLNAVAKRVANFNDIFKHSYLFQVFQPTYPSGHYLGIFASDKVHPTKTAIDWKGFLARNLPTLYYNPEMHYQAFVLPNFIRKAAPWSKVSLAEVPALYDPAKDGGIRYPPQIAIPSTHFLGGMTDDASAATGTTNSGQQQDDNALGVEDVEDGNGGLDPHDAPRDEL